MSGQLGLHELFQQVRSIVYGIWRKRWYMLLSAWVVCILGWSLTMSMPYRFMSTGTLYVNDEVITKIIGAKNSNTNKLGKVKNLILSNKNLTSIIRRTELNQFLITDAQLRDAVNTMKDNISVVAKAGYNYVIEYETADKRLNENSRRAMAKFVVDQLMQLAGENAVSPEGGDLEVGIDFIEKEIRTAKRQAELSENEKSAFAARYVQIINGGNLLQKLQTEQGKLRQAEREKRELDKKLLNANQQLKITPKKLYVPKSQIGNDGKTIRAGIEKRLEEQKKKLDSLKAAGLKPAHPFMKSVLTSIEGIQAELDVENKRIQSEIAKVKETNQENEFVRVDPNPVYENLFAKINDYINELITTDENVSEYKANVARLERNVKDGPSIMTKYRELQRVSKALRKNVGSKEKERDVLQRKQDAERAGGAIINVTRKASNSSRPSGPPRVLYLTLALVGGLMIGLGVAFILSQLRPVVLSVEQLRDHFDLPILGNVTVMMDETGQKNKRKEMLMFGGSGAAMIGLFVVLIVIDSIAI